MWRKKGTHFQTVVYTSYSNCSQTFSLKNFDIKTSLAFVFMNLVEISQKIVNLAAFKNDNGRKVLVFAVNRLKKKIPFGIRDAKVLI